MSDAHRRALERAATFGGPCATQDAERAARRAGEGTPNPALKRASYWSDACWALIEASACRYVLQGAISLPPGWRKGSQRGLVSWIAPDNSHVEWGPGLEGVVQWGPVLPGPNNRIGLTASLVSYSHGGDYRTMQALEPAPVVLTDLYSVCTQWDDDGISRAVLGPHNAILVTRHRGLAEHLHRAEPWTRGIPLLEHVTEEDVRNKHVVGVLPFSLASAASSVTEIGLDIPAALRGVELSAAQVATYARPLATYVVSRG